MKCVKIIFILFVAVLNFSGLQGIASAQVLTNTLEVKRISNVGAAWQTIALDNTYKFPVVVCTYNLPSISEPSATVRVQNTLSNSFQVRIQQFENSNIVTPYDVHCIISETGAFKLDGTYYEARTVESVNTSGQYVTNGWGEVNLEEVTASLTLKYTTPVVLGQVMTFNDAKASVFWTNNCPNRNRRPFELTNRICVGKHIGMIKGTRKNETLGYIVAEQGSGSMNDIKYELALGADSVAGTANAAPYNYTLGADYDIGVATQNGEDGGNGGWAVLYGKDPLPNNKIGLAIEEEVFAGDTSRKHTTEHVSYWVFGNEQKVKFTATKDVSMSSASFTNFAIPGSDVEYTISVENTGSSPVDLDTIFIADTLPEETIFYNSDIDGPGPKTTVTSWTSVGSGLTYNETTDFAVSTSPTKPSSFAACSPPSGGGYLPAVTYLCFNPKGKMNPGNVSTSKFQISFRVGIE